jgi:hypothetical protein
MDVNGHLPFLDVLVKKKEGSLTNTVFRKPTHTGRYLHYKSNHPMLVKRGVIRSLFRRDNKLCHNEQDNWTELELVKNELATNANPGKFLKSHINKKPRYGKICNIWYWIIWKSLLTSKLTKSRLHFTLALTCSIGPCFKDSTGSCVVPVIPSGGQIL